MNHENEIKLVLSFHLLIESTSNPSFSGWTTRVFCLKFLHKQNGGFPKSRGPQIRQAHSRGKPTSDVAYHIILVGGWAIPLKWLMYGYYMVNDG